MHVEWICEGCGVNVYAFGIDAPPAHGFCSTCAWLCEFVTDPQEIERIRRDRGEFGLIKRVDPKA